MTGTKVAYDLDTQVGFLLRQVTQRHLGIFAARVPDVTPTQFAALAKLSVLGPTSQNALGRATAMDAATIKGVVDRLKIRGYVETRRDPDDQRRIFVAPTPAGQSLFDANVDAALQISDETLAPLSGRERETLLGLLNKLT
ncbi:MAG: MarR family winged helix-turn-helix transcriptional regulator [Pseudomonadota bacterium]